MRRRANLGHLATVSVLAILAGETPVYAGWHPWRKDGLWKFKHIYQFINRNEKLFKMLVPGFNPPGSGFGATLNCYTNPEQFAELFIAWTKDVNLHYPSIQVCDNETARSGFNTYPSRVLIWAAYNWMKQNPEAEKIVKELFTSVKRQENCVRYVTCID